MCPDMKFRLFHLFCSLLFSLGIITPAAAGPATLLPTRAISFHHCDRVDRDLVTLARQLGYNEVQLQMENGNLERLHELADIQKKNHLLDFIHGQGMKVSVWLHELEDLPDNIGPITLENEALWKLLRERYRHILGDLLPDVDVWVLTVVESKIRVTDPRLLSKLVEIVNDACREHHKQLVVRTFVWYPNEFERVMASVKTLPGDTVIMTKSVPQDWHIRGTDDRAIGAVAPHEQLIEFDIAGEYFYKNAVANCFPETLTGQMERARAKGATGICVRVDRGEDDVLHNPQEVNLWALAATAGCKIPGAPAPLPSQHAAMLEAVWHAYAVHEFGPRAANAAVEALRNSGNVVAEALCVGPFSFADSRTYPPFDKPAFDNHWQPQWWEPRYLPLYEKAKRGDPGVILAKESSTRISTAQAQEALDSLERHRALFRPEDYTFLHAKLTANLDFIQTETPIQLAYLRMRALENTTDGTEKARLRAQLQGDLDQLKKISAISRPTIEVERQGRKVSVVQRPLNPDNWIAQLETFLAAR